MHSPADRGGRIAAAWAKKGYWKASVFLAFTITGCCHYPKSHVSVLGPANASSSSSSSLTIVAYGDTRTGPWGLGDNQAQAIHGRVVGDILAHDGPIDAVIFTGDAVMSTFYLWEKAYWDCFLCQSNRFRSAGIPFYPSLGNHEVLSPAVPVIKSTTALQEPSGPKVNEKELAEAYDRGEEPTPAPPKEIQTEAGIRQSSDPGQLKKLEKYVNRGDADSATKFGQFERDVQQNFYAEPKDERCRLDANTFKKAYLSRAKYDYLKEVVNRGGNYYSYYSKVLRKGPIAVTLIALDTNCLDSPEQQKFFAETVGQSSGPIIVFGHHPPVAYGSPDGWPWDKVKGWGERDSDPLKSYFENPQGSKIVLWIFGHVHDYQRRSQRKGNGEVVPPVLLVAGGGGAPLDKNAASFQWQPPSWPNAIQQSAYSQVKIVLSGSGIAVQTRGSTQRDGSFGVIDEFTIPWPQVPAK